MTESNLVYEADRWELLSRSAAVCAAEAERVARSLAVAERTNDGRWRVPGGTQRDADRARLSAQIVGALANELET
jgi:hypothetical protein